MCGRHGAVQAGDTAAVRVDLRISELGRDPFFKLFRNKVLQAFGFVVHFIHRVVENFVQKSFDEPVMSHNFQCPFLPCGR